MRHLLTRVAIALVFISTITLAIGGHPMTGQAGEPPKQYFPLMSANVPAQTDPAFRDYVGVGVSDADGDIEIYTIRGDSSELRQLTHNEVEEITPTFSPDGTRIAFGRRFQVSNSTRFIHQIYVMNRDGSNQTLLLEAESSSGNGYLAVAEWSPRGQHLLIYGRMPEARLWLVELDGTTHPLGPVFDGWESWAWSPDGQYVSYVTISAYTLQVRNVLTEATVTIGTNVSGVWWSPNSRELLLYKDNQPYLVLADGSELRLAATGTYAPRGWLANGRDLLLKSYLEGDENFYTVARDGGAPLPLTQHVGLEVGGSMDETRTGILYRTYSGDIASLYWLPFATRTSHFLASYRRGQLSSSGPVVSFDHRTLLYDISRCGSRICYSVNQKVRLDAETLVAVPSGLPADIDYLPLSSNRAFVQTGGYPGYENYKMQMVQFEPLSVADLDFPVSSLTRYITEWKYLP